MLTCSEVLNEAQSQRRHVLGQSVVKEDLPEDASKEDKARATREFHAAQESHDEALAEADELVERAQNRENCI